MAKSEDIGVEQISGFLKSLTDLINSDTAKQVLEVERNKMLANELTRLERSLDQYVTRKDDLFYIGLMGHFSTGKSSTINSLLDLNGKEHARNIGVNPTDKHVTLITHPQNTSSLIALNSESSVPIRTYPIEHPLLKTIVLADTPGAGDPALMNDLMQDFLPVCDLVLYFFSAASPLDTADMPVLEQLHKHLPFLPKHFIVSRADEFRKDKQKCLSDENFDHSRAELEIGNLITRTKELIPSFSIAPDDYILIDNIIGHGIEELRDRIANSGSCVSTADRVNMHLHKQIYFKSRAIAIRNEYLEIAEQKVATLMRFVGAAKDNIDGYQEKVLITNNRLTTNWSKLSSQLEQVRDETLSQIPEIITDELLPPDIWSHIMVKQWREIWSEETLSSAQNDMTSWSESIRRSSRSYAHHMVGKLQKIINSEDILSDQLDAELCNVSVSFESKIWLDLKCIKSVSTSIYSLYSRMVGAVIEANRVIIDKADILLKITETKMPLDRFMLIHEEARQNICNDIDTFLEMVRIYHSAMFAMGLKQYIAELGIGQPLDDIEKGLARDFCDSIKAAAMSRLFPEHVAERNAFKIGADDFVAKIHRACESLQSQSTLKSISREEIKGNCEPEFADVYEVAEQEKERVVTKVQDIITECVSGLKQQIANGLNKMASRRREILKRRSNLALKIAASVAILGLIGYMIFNWKVAFDGNRLGSVLGVGLSVNLISFFLTWFLSHSMYGFKKREAESCKVIVSEVKDNCNGILDSTIASVENIEVNETLLGEAIQVRQGTILDRESLSDTVKLYELAYAKAISGGEVLAKCGNAYNEAISSLHDIHQQAFANYDQNLQVLEEISSLIRKKAIEPSFSKLEELEAKFKEVKTALENSRLE